MERRIGTLMMIGFIAAFVTVSTLERDALARAGGGKSFGNKGSRSYSRPVAPPAQPSPAQQMQPRQSPMTPPPYQQPQPAGGGFFRSMAGGIVGGMLGGMLFRSLGFGGGGWGGGFGGSGIGLFEIILLVGIGYLIYRFVRGRKEESVPGGGMYGQGSFGQSSSPGYQSPSYTPYQAPVAPPPAGRRSRYRHRPYPPDGSLVQRGAFLRPGNGHLLQDPGSMDEPRPGSGERASHRRDEAEFSGGH